MKSDLTCPIEVVRVDISRETRENGMEQVTCAIAFHSLTEDKPVDSVQMNIVCFSADGMRLGGRLVRAHVHEMNGPDFSGVFLPEHVNGTARVEASVEKVWFKDGVIWRREERNVREYQSNQLPEGRELDRLRTVAGPDAVGYAVEEDTVWLCVCGRANRTSDDCCRRCKRDRQTVITSFSKEVIEATLGEKERALEAQSKESLVRSTEQTAREMEAERTREKKQKKRVQRIITVLILLIFVLSAWRWLVPIGADMVARDRLASGKAADAKKIYEWIGRYWPDEYDAEAKALAAERVIIQRLISMNSEDTLKTAEMEAESIGDETLMNEASLALAQLYIDRGKRDDAESLLRELPGSEAAVSLLKELLYSRATEAKEKLEYDTAIGLFEELSGYMDSDEQRIDSIYLQARQMMREGKMEAAQDRFLEVVGYLDSLTLLRRCRYALAGEKRESGDLQEAAALYESLGVYEDAENLGKACRYESGMAAVSAGDLASAAEQLKMAEDYEDARQRFEEVAFTLGSQALRDEAYETAIFWLEQLPMVDEVQAGYNEATYALAQQQERAGARDEAILLYASLGDYEDAAAHMRQLEYDLAREQMASGAYEDALDRFEGLDNYLDSKEQAETCIREIAEEAYSQGDYDKAILYYRQMSDSKAAQQQVVRCLYAIAVQMENEGRYKESADYYAQCGAYRDAEEKTVEMRYRWAESLEQKGEYALAAAAFRVLGGYLDAVSCMERCEDLWLGDVYRNARLDLETGNYLSVINALDPYLHVALPKRYQDIPTMVEEACLGRAQELIDIGHPLDALPFLERIPENKTAKKRLNDYVYRVIGRWKDRNGLTFIFRRDGTCTIDGLNLYYGGTGYELFVGEEPYPTKRTYQVINLRGSSLTLRDFATDNNIRLTYVGEPTPIETETDGPDKTENVPAEDK